MVIPEKYDLPANLADYKAYLTNRYPTRRFFVGITPMAYKMLWDNDQKKRGK